MSEGKSKKGVVIGYVVIAIIGFSILGMAASVWAKPYLAVKDTTKTALVQAPDSALPVVITENANDVFAESKQVDTSAINAAFLQNMREKGELLSSGEFASRITGYYNTLVAVLTALFVLFTIVTYLTIRSKFDSKFEDKARDLEDKQRQKIVDELRNMLSDSKQLDEVIKSAVGGRVDDSIATQEEVDNIATDLENYGKNILSISTDLGDVKNKQRELYKVVTELQEQVADVATVYNGKVEDNNEDVVEKEVETTVDEENVEPESKPTE